MTLCPTRISQTVQSGNFLILPHITDVFDEIIKYIKFRGSIRRRENACLKLACKILKEKLCSVR